MTKTNTLKEHLQRAILVTCDIWETDCIFDNWKAEFVTIFVTWQLRVTLDSIRNSCDVLNDGFPKVNCQIGDTFLSRSISKILTACRIQKCFNNFFGIVLQRAETAFSSCLESNSACYLGVPSFTTWDCKWMQCRSPIGCFAGVPSSNLSWCCSSAPPQHSSTLLSRFTSGICKIVLN